MNPSSIPMSPPLQYHQPPICHSKQTLSHDRSKSFNSLTSGQLSSGTSANSLQKWMSKVIKHIYSYNKHGVFLCIFHQTSDKKIQLFRRKLPTRRVASILEKPVSDLGGFFFSRSAKGGISQPLPPACFQAETGWTWLYYHVNSLE